MQTVTKRAWNPDTGQEYEIELPDNNVVEKALLEIYYPPAGLGRREIQEMLAERFSLTNEQRNAENKTGHGVFNTHVGGVRGRLIKEGKLMGSTDEKTHINSKQKNKLVEDTKSGLNHQVNPSIGSAKPHNKSYQEKISKPPERTIEEKYQQIRKELATELLQQIKNNPPAFFEKLVVDLLVAMGYGGSREDAEAVGRSGDGGIDGIINEDRLGLDVIYIQAKRWEGNVSRPEIQKFAGALQGQRAQKGVFITTSNFTREATGYVDTIPFKIVLIDGHQLAQLMIDHDVGVSVEKTYEIKRVDSDYFTESTENP